MNFPERIDRISDVLAEKTACFAKSFLGKIFLNIVLLGPLTFLPTLWQAWTAEDINALRTSTWPLMIVVNIATLFSLIHNGDWRMRLVVVVWILIVSGVYIATLIR